MAAQTPNAHPTGIGTSRRNDVADPHPADEEHPYREEDGQEGYKNFRDNQNEWTKVVLRP